VIPRVGTTFCHFRIVEKVGALAALNHPTPGTRSRARSIVRLVK